MYIPFSNYSKSHKKVGSIIKIIGSLSLLTDDHGLTEDLKKINSERDPIILIIEPTFLWLLE